MFYFVVGRAPFCPADADVEFGDATAQTARNGVSPKILLAIAERAMVISGGVSSHSQAVTWQHQVKSVAANVTETELVLSQDSQTGKITKSYISRAIYASCWISEQVFV